MINNTKISLLTVVGIIFSFISILNAQNISPVIEKSNQKVIYKGEIYYIHKVAKGNTLFSICKVYQVTEEDIKKANPSAILNPLSIGQTLRIPADSKIASVIQTDVQTTTKENKDFIFHIVQAGETSSSLHRKYKVPLAAIYKYNPESASGISIGQTIKIPKQHLLKPQPAAEDTIQKKTIYYTVQQGDTLYRIAKDYGISVSALILANEELRWGLKTGQVIIIPPYSDYGSLTYSSALDSILLVSEMARLSIQQCDSIASAYKMRTAVKVALVLPFFADEKFSHDYNSDNDTLDSIDIHQKQSHFKGRVAVEFYEGLLLAIDSLKERNIDINLFVYDSEADTNKVKKIIGDLEIIQPNLILGPFLPDNVALMNKFSTEKMIPFVPPLMKDDSTLRHNPNLFQVLPSHISELEIWSDYLSENYNENILFICKRNLFKQAEIDQFKTVLLEKLKDRSDGDTLRFTEIHINDTLQYNISKYLSDSLENIVIVASSYEPEVSDVLTKLYFVHKTKKIKVFGMPIWQKFKSIRIDYFHDMNVEIYSPFFIDYNDLQVKSFVAKCRTALKYEPFMTTSKGTGLNYTFLGYDLGTFFISALKKYGEVSCDCIRYYQPDLLLSSYSFKKNKIYGFNENTSISIIKYTEDIRIERRKIESSGN